MAFYVDEFGKQYTSPKKKTISKGVSPPHKLEAEEELKILALSLFRTSAHTNTIIVHHCIACAATLEYSILCRWIWSLYVDQISLRNTNTHKHKHSFYIISNCQEEKSSVPMQTRSLLTAWPSQFILEWVSERHFAPRLIPQFAPVEGNCIFVFIPNPFYHLETPHPALDGPAYSCRTTHSAARKACAPMLLVLVFLIEIKRMERCFEFVCARAKHGVCLMNEGEGVAKCRLQAIVFSRERVRWLDFPVSFGVMQSTIERA